MTERKKEITETYLNLMRKHLDDVRLGRSEVIGLKEISEEMHIHARHLSNVVKNVTGKSPCDFFEEELVHVLKELLSIPENRPSRVAVMIGYDPSNFTKFFKKYVGQTPSQYRKQFIRN